MFKAFLTSSFVKSAFMGVTRHLIAGAGAVLATDGFLTPAQSTNEWLGSGMFIAGVIWSIYQKYEQTGKLPSL